MLDLGESEVHQDVNYANLPFEVSLLVRGVTNGAIIEVHIKNIHDNLCPEDEDHHEEGEHDEHIEDKLCLHVLGGALLEDGVDLLIHHFLGGHPENDVKNVENQNKIDVPGESVTYHDGAVGC